MERHAAGRPAPDRCRCCAAGRRSSPGSSSSRAASTGRCSPPAPAGLARRGRQLLGPQRARSAPRAFAETCGLPALPGRKPFGGDILSHDFVEAALLRRAGWARAHAARAWAAATKAARRRWSTLDARDRRWCQGNLQHAAVIGARGAASAEPAAPGDRHRVATSARRCGWSSWCSASRRRCRRASCGRTTSPTRMRCSRNGRWSTRSARSGCSRGTHGAAAGAEAARRAVGGAVGAAAARRARLGRAARRRGGRRSSSPR